MKLNITSIIATALLVSSGIEATLTSSQKQDLLELHKNARSKINAPDMKPIKWDDSLAAAAQEYSEQCKGMVHSGPRENLAGSTTGDVTRMFNNWMKEKDDFEKSGYRSSLLNIYYNDKDIGHYSQIVWADNTKIGCGLTYCENYHAKYLLVCRYGIGNILKRQVYSLPSNQKDDSNNKKSDDQSREVKVKTTTTTRSTTTTATTTTTTIKTTTTEERKATPEPKVTSKDKNESSSQSVPTVNSSVVLGNSTVADDNNKKTENSVKVEANNDKTVKPDGTVETKNINENYKKDGIIDEVGQSTYVEASVSGVATTGSS
ncbi:hypothetical protein PIROE2DRAFT_1772, partial [Piromyces sp. E2]